MCSAVVIDAVLALLVLVEKQDDACPAFARVMAKVKKRGIFQISRKWSSTHFLPACLLCSRHDSSRDSHLVTRVLPEIGHKENEHMRQRRAAVSRKVRQPALFGT